MKVKVRKGSALPFLIWKYQIDALLNNPRTRQREVKHCWVKTFNSLEHESFKKAVDPIELVLKRKVGFPILQLYRNLNCLIILIAPANDSSSASILLLLQCLLPLQPPIPDRKTKC